MLTGFLGLAICPFGEGEVDLLTAQSFGSVGLLEAVPHHVGAQVRVRDVSHSRCSPERHRRVRRHFVLLASLLANVQSPLQFQREFYSGSVRVGYSVKLLGYPIYDFFVRG